MRESWRRRKFAQAYDRLTAAAENRFLGELRSELLAGCHGRVLEIGAGTGANLTHYPSSAHLTLAEPSAAMREQLRARVAKLGMAERCKVVDSSAEALGSLRCERSDESREDDTYDYVVSALVLCSVADVKTALAGIGTVLAPGGALGLIEHVHHDGAFGALQTALTPAQRLCAGGCRLNRRTIEHLQVQGYDTAGVRMVDHPGAGLARPLAVGWGRLGAPLPQA